MQLAAEPAGVIAKGHDRMAGLGRADGGKVCRVQDELPVMQGDEVVSTLSGTGAAQGGSLGLVRGGAEDLKSN